MVPHGRKVQKLSRLHHTPQDRRFPKLRVRREVRAGVVGVAGSDNMCVYLRMSVYLRISLSVCVCVSVCVSLCMPACVRARGGELSADNVLPTGRLKFDLMVLRSREEGRTGERVEGGGGGVASRLRHCLGPH